jgi:uncharacterized membrane protein
MSNRSIHITVYSFLVGCLMFSIATNLFFYNRILILQDFLLGANTWITKDQFNSIKEEITRLEKDKYQIP